MLTRLLFPQPVSMSMIDVDTQPILDRIDQEREASSGRVVSNVNGWQSNDYRPDDAAKFSDTFVELIDIIHSQVVFVARQYLNAQPPLLLNYWFNINTPGSSNAPHVHPGCLLAACFYLKVPEGSGDIVFNRQDGYQHLNIRSASGAHTEASAHVWSERPKDNMLAVFPATLLHGVTQNRSTEDRISVAFNFGY